MKQVRDATAAILAANAQDLDAAKKGGSTAAFLDRVKLDPGRVASIARGLEEIAAQPEPVGAVISA